MVYMYMYKKLYNVNCIWLLQAESHLVLLSQTLIHASTCTRLCKSTPSSSLHPYQRPPTHSICLSSSETCISSLFISLATSSSLVRSPSSMSLISLFSPLPVSPPPPLPHSSTSTNYTIQRTHHITIMCSEYTICMLHTCRHQDIKVRVSCQVYNCIVL